MNSLTASIPTNKPAANLTSKWHYVALAAIMCVAVLVRTLDFGALPNGLNRDEAFAGYEAFSMLKYGIDSAGNHNPVYLTPWGSSMNALESYLIMPFIALLGNTAVAVRLPQLIVGLLTFPIMYQLMRTLFPGSAGRKVALVSIALLAIVPWHVMLCRWGLESNLAPAFLLTGVYLVAKGMQKPAFLLASAVAFGLALYCYAITWVYVPLLLLALGGYLLWVARGNRGNRAQAREKQAPVLGVCEKEALPFVVGAAVILACFAAPLVLFFFVNKGVIPPITTEFLTIPKLVVMRASEFSPANLLNPENWLTVCSFVFGLPGKLLWNSVPEFGLFYYISAPFIVVGLISCTRRLAKSLRTRTFDTIAFIIIPFFCAFFICLLFTHPNVNKCNCMHLFTLALAAVGVVRVFECIPQKFPQKVKPKALLCACAVVYAGFFGTFCWYYFTQYNERIAWDFTYDAGKAITWVKENAPEKECLIDGQILYPVVLFYDEMPPREFLDTVQYIPTNDAFLHAGKFGQFQVGFNLSSLSKESVYISRITTKEYFTKAGFETIDCGLFFVAFSNQPS